VSTRYLLINQENLYLKPFKKNILFQTEFSNHLSKDHFFNFLFLVALSDTPKLQPKMPKLKVEIPENYDNQPSFIHESKNLSHHLKQQPFSYHRHQPNSGEYFEGIDQEDNFRQSPIFRRKLSKNGCNDLPEHLKKKSSRKILIDKSINCNLEPPKPPSGIAQPNFCPRQGPVDKTGIKKTHLIKSYKETLEESNIKTKKLHPMTKTVTYAQIKPNFPDQAKPKVSFKTPDYANNYSSQRPFTYLFGEAGKIKKPKGRENFVPIKVEKQVGSLLVITVILTVLNN